MSESYRPGLEPPPARIAHLPIDRGYPVPWFVAWIDGKPEFRLADAAKMARAVRENLCWVCGQALGRYLTFPIGPMCAINRISAEPPCHLECARYSARNCPFLSKPQMERRENDLPAGGDCDGHMIRRNPGVTLLWTTRSYALVGDGRGGVLFRIGDSESTEWYAQGRAATRAEVEESIHTGLPILVEMARAQGPDAVAELARLAKKIESLLPMEGDQQCSAAIAV